MSVSLKVLIVEDETPAVEKLERYLQKYSASITVAGVSLTVVGAESDRFSVQLIPHTLEVTTLGELKPGDVVNLETDLLAKYVERQLALGPRQ